MDALNGIADEKLTGPASPHRFSDRIGIRTRTSPTPSLGRAEVRASKESKQPSRKGQLASDCHSRCAIAKGGKGEGTSSETLKEGRRR